jgi:hypothetical protein
MSGQLHVPDRFTPRGKKETDEHQRKERKIGSHAKCNKTRDMNRLELLILVSNKIIANYFLVLFVWVLVKLKKTANSNHMKALPFPFLFREGENNNKSCIAEVHI